MNNSDVTRIRFKSAFVDLGSGGSTWQEEVVVAVCDGQIIDVQANRTDPEAEPIAGVAIPAMVNVHSHAFQRGFSGLSEFRTAAKDSFWTWRELMYDFVNKLAPDDVFVIARQLYLEMIVAGYSWVGEFHYLHNDRSGKQYDNRNEMADSLLRAASETGIGICLLPVLYQQSGFDGKPVGQAQRRFNLKNDDFFLLMDECQTKIKSSPNATMGMAIHSLRAVARDSINAALDNRNRKHPDCPVHIHVAEQVQEIDDCLKATGKRSVEYLLSEFDVDETWCLIHATHMNPTEVQRLASTGATVGLCPTTEANLGDGFFPAETFLHQQGSISIGSDSHCSVDPWEELRLFEYGQRLKTQNRAILGTESLSVGRRLFSDAATGGAKSIGVSTGSIAVGCRADLIVIDDEHPTIAGATRDRILDRLVFSGTGNPISRRMIGGHWIETKELESMLAFSRCEFLELNRRLFR